MEKTTTGFDARYILHIDADAFFVSVEEALNPSLKGKLNAVGSNNRRGVICSSSYSARKFAIHAGMATSKALALCPNLLILEPKSDMYRFFSQQLFEILSQYSPCVEKTSIDEGYIDLTGTELMWGMSAKELAVHILKQIRTKLKIPVSGGLASNKLVAQIASKIYKPHKFINIPHGHEKAFLWPLPLKVVPGIGKRTETFFNQKGIFKVEHFATQPLERIIKEFGAHGLHLWQRLNGLKQDELQIDEVDPKSISHETTFAEDLDDINEVRHKLTELINKVLFRLRKQKLHASGIFLKLRSSNFNTSTFHRKLPYPSAFEGDIIEEGKFLLRENFHPLSPLRLIGFGVDKLKSTYNLSIFQKDLDLKNKLVSHMDLLRKKHGFEVVSYGV